MPKYNHGIDFSDIARAAKCSPTQAIYELVANGFDAMATEIKINFGNNGLGKVNKITISDNGDGIDSSNLETTFAKKGYTNKNSVVTKKERDFIGCKGVGRYRAWSLGDNVTWKSYDKLNSRYHQIVMAEDGIDCDFVQKIPNLRKGTIAEIHNDSKNYDLTVESLYEKLSQMFAIYILKYGVSIKVSGNNETKPIDKSTIKDQLEQKDITLDIKYNDKKVVLRLYFWKNSKKKFDTIFLCNHHGYTMEERPEKAPNNISIHILCEEFQTGSEIFSQEINQIIKNCLQHAMDWSVELAQKVHKDKLDDLKNNGIYPSVNNLSLVDETEKNILESMSIMVSDYIDINHGNAKSRDRSKLILSLANKLLEHDVESFIKVVQDVVKLDKLDIERTNNILQYTSLTNLLNLGRECSNRLLCLKGIRNITQDGEKMKTIKERTHLHKIIERNCWIFGEEYNLAVTDQNTTNALKEIIKDDVKTYDDLVIGDVKDFDGKIGVIDLLLSMRNNRNEHLLIELKRPSVKVGEKAIQQTKKYCMALTKHHRWEKGRKIKAIAVSTDVDEYGESDRENENHQVGFSADYTIHVKKWCEILNEAESRVTNFQKEVLNEINESEGYAYIKELHKDILG
ncbi:MAG: ATP-binding protein [Pseudomonadota bacterium]